MNSNKVFNLADVSPHNNSKDCWVIINARVYDVTNFLNDHPGGDNVLLDVAGKDASDEFEEVGHGSAARLMLDEYYIGEIDHVEVEPLYDISKKLASKYNKNTKKQQTITKEDKGLGINLTMKFILLVVSTTILGVAIGFLLYK
ncbi:unnamed protein product [Lactuca saligna]|uniref:Cytochrome b5 heme-binding domain-containing protein n=1 Tax=Lactuca saligna TaxID=75948 RepID=A0AA35ZE23_LACSI|nr:unnamed protein product [Lactuca saligna]